jgi:hypothetical protein
MVLGRSALLLADGAELNKQAENSIRRTSDQVTTVEVEDRQDNDEHAFRTEAIVYRTSDWSLFLYYRAGVTVINQTSTHSKQSSRCEAR